MSLSGVRDLLQRHHRALALGGVLLALAALWLGSAAYAAPVAHRTVERSTAWSEESAFTYAVPVTRNSTHWPAGTVLPMGHPAYFRTISDTILVNFTWRPTSSDPYARGMAAGDLVVEIRAQAHDGRPYWSIVRPLDEVVAEDATQGLALSGRLDLDALVHEVVLLQREQPVEGRINWTVRAKVVYAFEAGGRRDQGETERVLVMGVGDPRFTLPTADDLTWTKSHVRESVRTSTRQAGVPGVVASAPTLSLAGGAIALLAAALFTGRLAPDEAFEAEYRRHKEWVSTARRIPEGSADAATTVDVDSLEDLIHVAADARTRVLLDERSRVFYAFLPGATYRYARHAY